MLCGGMPARLALQGALPTGGSMPTRMGAVNPVTSSTVHLGVSITCLDPFVFPRLGARAECGSHAGGMGAARELQRWVNLPVSCSHVVVGKLAELKADAPAPVNSVPAELMG